MLVVASPLFAADRVALDRNDEAGTLRIMIDGQEKLVYVYGPAVDIQHYFPVRSPSGKSMTVEQTDPYPHHRSFWFADKVQLEQQRVAAFYSALYSRQDKDDPQSPCVDRVRHVEFSKLETNDEGGQVDSKLVWEMDLGKTPVLDETRTMRIVPLDKGQYFLDISYRLTSSYGDVTFMSDAVHYAWPYIRMNKTFNVQDGGGKIVNSEGGVNQAGTNGKVARWVDYSCRVDDETEGLAVFSHPANGSPVQWLTRDYGTFGPRRVQARSGKRFVVSKGESIEQRVGIFVHRGDLNAADLNERYQAYVAGSL